MLRSTEAGATSAEYGLLIALIAGTLVLAVSAFGLVARDTYTTACDRMLAGGVSTTIPNADCD